MAFAEEFVAPYTSPIGPSRAERSSLAALGSSGSTPGNLALVVKLSPSRIFIAPRGEAYDSGKSSSWVYFH